MQIPNHLPGPQVRLKRLNDEAQAVDFATISLGSEGAVSDNQELMAKWQKAGILGRPEAGRVFPKDGQRFLEELPYIYRSTHFWAEKVPPPQS